MIKYLYSDFTIIDNWERIDRDPHNHFSIISDTVIIDFI